MNPWKLVRQRQGPEISDGYQPMKLRRKLPRSNFELPHDSLWFRVRAGCRDARSALSNRTCCASKAVDDCSGARLGASEVIGLAKQDVANTADGRIREFPTTAHLHFAVGEFGDVCGKLTASDNEYVREVA